MTDTQVDPWERAAFFAAAGWVQTAEAWRQVALLGGHPPPVLPVEETPAAPSPPTVEAPPEPAPAEPASGCAVCPYCGSPTVFVEDGRVQQSWKMPAGHTVGRPERATGRVKLTCPFLFDDEPATWWFYPETGAVEREPVTGQASLSVG